MKLKSNPALYGLIGYPVKHSLSPLMHNAAFKALKINARYRLFEVKPEELENFLLGNIPIKDTEGKDFFSQEIRGFNITIPHKIRAKEILEKHFPEGAGIAHYVHSSGAVNTVKRKGKKMYYLNTDITGFRQSLQKDLGFNPKDKNVLLIGCGGAGRAVVAALAWRTLPDKIYIYEPNHGAACSAEAHFSSFTFLNNRFKFISREQLPDFLKVSDLLINASPVGMKKDDPSIIEMSLLEQRIGQGRELFIYDLVYNRETPLVRNARELRIKAVGGKGMLLYQGLLAFGFWMGKTAPIEEVMREALEKGLRQCQSK
jgi:shikimate dehydrogenase